MNPATGISSAANGCRPQAASISRTRPRSPGRRSAVARSTEADIDKALDAAHGAAPQWGKTAVAERAVILNKIADRIEDNLESLALAEAWDNGKPIRETLNADLPLAVDHFRYSPGRYARRSCTSSRSTEQHRRLPLPRAARRGRADHPVELPDPDGRLETGAGAGRRQRGGATKPAEQTRPRSCT